MHEQCVELSAVPELPHALSQSPRFCGLQPGALDWMGVHVAKRPFRHAPHDLPPREKPP
jgi:hypothetical protein